MAIGESSLSIACTEFAEFIRSELDTSNNDIIVSMGTPAGMPKRNDRHGLNLFFYRFEPSGFVFHTRPDQTARIRTYCLLSVRGIDDNGISGGENELRILGEIIRLFNETPLLSQTTINGERASLEVIYHPLEEDQLNQLWSTQGDTTLQPSLAYEIALLPIVPTRPWAGAPAVGTIGHQVSANVNPQLKSFTGSIYGPDVPRSVVNVEAEDWSPRICFVDDGFCFETKAIEGSEQGAYTVSVWIAGDPNETVTLVWQVWDSFGLRDTGDTVVLNPHGSTIDPENIPESGGGFPSVLSLPNIGLPLSESRMQFFLYATRQYQPANLSSPVTLKSNPLLMTVYRSEST
jgi:hypothetical protein